MSETIQIKHARSSDARMLAVLHYSDEMAFSGIDPCTLDTPDNYETRIQAISVGFEDAINHCGKRKILVAYMSRSVVGLCDTSSLSTAEARINALRVHPRFTHRGVATALLEFTQYLYGTESRLKTAVETIAIDKANFLKSHGFETMQNGPSDLCLTRDGCDNLPTVTHDQVLNYLLSNPLDTVGRKYEIRRVVKNGWNIGPRATRQPTVPRVN